MAKARAGFATVMALDPGSPMRRWIRARNPVNNPGIPGPAVTDLALAVVVSPPMRSWPR